MKNHMNPTLAGVTDYSCMYCAGLELCQDSVKLKLYTL